VTRARRLARLLPAAALILAGCGADPYPDDVPGTFHAYFQTEMKGFDPIVADEETRNYCVQNVYDSLYEYHWLKRPYELKPCLAAAMPTISEDGLTYTIPLQKGVRFADDPCFPGGKGREFVAADAIFCFQRIMDSRLASPGTFVFDGKVAGLDEFKAASKWMEKDLHRSDYTPKPDEDGYDVDGYPAVAGLSAPDAHTLVIRLKSPYPQLLWVLAMGYTAIYPREAVARYGPEFMNHPVGTGPYLVSEYVPRQKLVLVRNPNYRTNDHYPTEGMPGDEKTKRLDDAGKRLPLNDRVVATVFVEQQPQWLYFQSGFLDRTRIPKDSFDGAIDPKTRRLLPELEERGVTLDKDPRLEVIYDCFNMRDPVVGAPAGEKGLAIRRAMSLAFDEEWARINLYNDRVSPLQGPIIEEFPEFDPAFVNPWKRRKDETREQVVVRARKVLADAGFPDGKGIPPIVYDTVASTTNAQFFLALQRDMKAIGIEMRSNRVTWQEQTQRVKEAKAQMWGVAWGADFPEAQNFLQLFYGPNKSPGPNGANYANPEFDALFDRAAVLQAGEERNRLYRRMQEIAVDQCVWIFKYRRLDFNLIQPWCHGYRFSSIGDKYFKYCRVDEQPRRDAVRALNRPQPLWAVTGLLVIGLGLGAGALAGRRGRRGW
jgi:oligopeptide transport system substrate-binding protein